MLSVAKIIKSNGTSGDVLIGLLDCELSDLTNEEPVYIEFDGLPVPFFVESISPKGSTRAIVHLTDVDSLQDAEELVGREIYIKGEASGRHRRRPGRYSWQPLPDCRRRPYPPSRRSYPICRPFHPYSGDEPPGGTAIDATMWQNTRLSGELRLK